MFLLAFLHQTDLDKNKKEINAQCVLVFLVGFLCWLTRQTLLLFTKYCGWLIAARDARFLRGGR
jgi:hypothetical protein